MKIKNIVILIGLILVSISQIKSQNQNQFELDENWLSQKKDFFENYNYSENYNSTYRDQFLKLQVSPNFESNDIEPKTRVEHDGLVTRTNKKYFILIDKPDEGMVEIPNGKIDKTKRYHIRQKEVE